MREKKGNQRADQRHDGHYSHKRQQGALDLFFYGIDPESHMHSS